MGISHDITPKRVIRNHPAKKDLFEDKFEEIKNSSSLLDLEEDGDKTKKENDEPEEVVLPIKSEEEILVNTKENDFFSKSRSSKEKKDADSKKPLITEAQPKMGLKKNPIWMLWLLFFILLLILAYQNLGVFKKLFTKNEPQTEKTDLTDKDDLETYDNETAAENSEQTSSQPATTPPESTETAQAPVVTAPAIDKALININILNGNGIPNSAALVKNELEKAGFTVKNAANAKKFTYLSTYVYYKSGKEAEANLVKDALPDREILLEQSDSLTTGYDIVIVVGKK